MKTHNTRQYPSQTQPRIAALSLAIKASDGATVQLTPDGVFKARDGRPEGLPGFAMSQPVADALLARLKSLQGDIVVDYEHQTLYSEQNGQPAPAAGWIDPHSIEYLPGVGLRAQVRWTATAQQHIDNDEYRYLSPVLEYDPRTGEVRDLLHVALTNFPAVDGMASVAIEALRQRLTAIPPNPNEPQKEDTPVEREQLIKLLGLAADASDEQIQVALKASVQAQTELAALRTELGADDNTQTTEAIAALKSQAEPDPSKYAPVSVVVALREQLGTLQKDSNEQALTNMVDEAVRDGRLLPAEKDWAIKYGKKDLAALKTYIGKSAAIAALKSTQTQGEPPEGAQQDQHQLTDDEVEAAKLTGRTPSEYAALKAQLSND